MLPKNRIAVSLNVSEVTPHVAIVFGCLSSEGIRRYMAVYFGVWYGWHHMTTSFNHINVQLAHPIREPVHITPTVVGVYRDWPGSSASNLYI